MSSLAQGFSMRRSCKEGKTRRVSWNDSFLHVVLGPSSSQPLGRIIFDPMFDKEHREQAQAIVIPQRLPPR